MSSVVSASMEPLAKLFGIQTSYEAAGGETVTASEASLLAALEALGADTSGDVEDITRREQDRAWSRLIEPVVVAWDGRINAIALHVSASAARRTIRYALRCEDGSLAHGTIPPSDRRIRRERRAGRGRRVELLATIRARVPHGYHELTITTEDDQGTAFLIAAPRRCFAGERPREWGVFAPLYALRETTASPIGDFDDLESLMRWTGQLGGDLVATLPISAAFLDEPFDPSPYSPASRLFWNELFLAREDGVAPPAGDPLVDYRAVHAQKSQSLRAESRDFFADGGRDTQRFREFVALYPDAEDYARFRARADDAAVEYHLYAQMLCHEQLSRLAANARAAGVRLYLDMPLGVHPDGYDVQRNRGLFLMGVSAGAPPDPFFTLGQNWGFPPLNPVAMREQRYAYWRKVLQTQLRYAGILRLDHVMALHRLYVVPNGFEATQGVYLRYPADELYAVLTLESMRHQAVIVGEDLGTVPAEVRAAMAEHGVKRMFVVQFEANESADPPLTAIARDAVASLNTHDMPTFHAYWEGLDADLRRDIGLIDEQGVDAARASRLQCTTALSRMLGSRTRLAAAEARTRMIEWLAASDADILLINLEDLWLETEPQNLPGTGQERPNWRRRMKYTLEQIRADASVRELLDRVEAARRSQETKS